MAKVAVMGYGTVGAGVVEVLTMNREVITRRVGAPIEVTHILDLRDFPGTDIEHLVTHDFNDILNDDQVDIVVETMGGLKPAYEFSKQALLAGKHVCTSNKELVAEHGVELCQIAKDNNVNYMFEASCGGGIPIIRSLNNALWPEDLEMVSGILNGTTNYILTSMYNDNKDFNVALKEAQEKGYAELHPEADIEGHDAQRKIAILSSLAYGKHIDYKDVPTQGITEIDTTDIQYAKAMDMKIKLLATSKKVDQGVWAMVAPMLVGKENQLSVVDDVMNAVFVKGNALGDAMFYGSGAGSLPTASAVVADVIDCARHLDETVHIEYVADPLTLMATDDIVNRFFVRTTASQSQVQDVFGDVQFVALDGKDECGFTTKELSESKFAQLCQQLDTVIKFIRMA